MNSVIDTPRNNTVVSMNYSSLQLILNPSSLSFMETPSIKLWPNKILTVLYLIIFITGLIGNVIVIYFVLFYKRMQSMTNKFITNLALADLLVIFVCIPDEIARLMEVSWKYEKFFCEITNFSQGLSLCVSVMTLTAISIDRYYIIHKPVRARSIYTHRRVRIIVIMIWVLSIIIMSPIFIVTKYETFPVPESLEILAKLKNLTICFENWPHMELKLIYGIFLSCILFLFPISFMSYAYYSISKTLWFMTEKKTEKTLKQALVEAVQIVSVTSLNSKRKSFFSRSKTCSKRIKVEAKQLNNPNVAPVAAILISSYEKPSSANKLNENKSSEKLSVNKLTDNKSGSPHRTLTPIATDETSCGLFERSSIDHQMLEIQKLSNNPRSYCCNSNNYTESKSNCQATQRRKSQEICSPLKSRTPGRSSFQQWSMQGDKLHFNPQRQFNPMINSVLNKNDIAINKLIYSRQRIVKLLIILLLLFIISWFPYHINGVAMDLAAIWDATFIENEQPSTKIISKTLIEELFPITLCLALANSATNPVCFILFNQSFRDKFKTSCCVCLKNSDKRPKRLIKGRSII